MRLAMTWIQSNSAANLILCPGPVPVEHHFDPCHYGVGFCQKVITCQRLLRRFFRFGEPRLCPLAWVESAHNIHLRQPRAGPAAISDDAVYDAQVTGYGTA